MAGETLSIDNETVTSELALRADLKKAGHDKLHVVLTKVVNADASPNDTTIYTVPSGMTLYVTKTIAGTNHIDTCAPIFHDSVGDVASGTGVINLNAFDINDQNREEVNYSPGVKFTKGITIKSTSMVASKNHYLDIHGFLV